MKKIQFLLFTSLLLLTYNSLAQSQTIEIPANETYELDYSSDESYAVTINNKSMKDLKIKVIDKNSMKQVRGFGLGKKAKEEVMVESTSKLLITNSGGKIAKVNLDIVKKNFPVQNPGRKYVSFTLENKSAKSIPLIIPTVMNPNLSPFSKSGVDLKIGQEIIFKNKGKRYVLLTVNDNIEDGAVLDVAKLLKEKKKELGLKS